MRPRRLLDPGNLMHELVTAFRAEYAHHRRQFHYTPRWQRQWQGVRFAMRWMWAWV